MPAGKGDEKQNINMKSFSQMTNAEFSSLKRKSKSPEFVPEFSGKKFDDMKILVGYFSNNKNFQNRQQDFDRWISSRYFSNEKLMQKVHEENESQRKALEERRKEIGIMMPEQFFSTKLFLKYNI